MRERPWTELRIPEGMGERFRFIEIPLEGDITTIVGGNENGKSHLLSAIAKVITGAGIPDERDKASHFDRTDLCHYASVRNKNADA
ncbi:MAG TPA: AAA family ATPase [Pirellulaceae bacterium]|nr:AAA family ATPase [Pirellulaceae bacterium]